MIMTDGKEWLDSKNVKFGLNCEYCAIHKQKIYYMSQDRMCVFYLLVGAYSTLTRGVMVKVMACGIVVSEFVLQSRYYVHFQANTLRKGMNPLILPVVG